MKRLIALFGALLFAASVSAQTGRPAQKPIATTPETAMPPGKIYVDRARIKGPTIGRTGFRVRVACEGTQAYCDTQNAAPNGGPSSLGGGNGAFRIGCHFSHAADDDPIVWPGQPGRTHGHAFFGNNSTSSQTDVSSMHTSGSSTCGGAWLNRSGYWTPYWVIDRPGHAWHGESLMPTHVIAYYKSEGMDYLATPNVAKDIVWPPPGHRMISGDPLNTGEVPLDVGSFGCVGGPGSTEIVYSRQRIHTYAEVLALPMGITDCREVIVIVKFEMCWNGTAGILGKGHMGAGDFYNGCTNPAFPILFPLISFQFHYLIPDHAKMDYYRLTSDLPASSGEPPGHSLHADWVNGWSTAVDGAWMPGLTGGKTVTDVILAECNHISMNCHVNILGNPVVSAPEKWWVMY